MPKSLHSIVTLLLVPCLLVDPTLAVALAHPLATPIVAQTTREAIWNEQALAPVQISAQRWSKGFGSSVALLGIFVIGLLSGAQSMAARTRPPAPGRKNPPGSRGVPAMRGPSMSRRGWLTAALAGVSSAALVLAQGNSVRSVQTDGFTDEEDRVVRGTLSRAAQYLPGFNAVLDDPQIKIQITQAPDIPAYFQELALQNPDDAALREFAETLRQDVLQGVTHDSLTATEQASDGRLIFLTIVQPDIFAAPGRLFRVLFHEMAHNTIYREHKDEILNGKFSLPRNEVEAIATERGIQAMEAISSDPKILALGSPAIEALRQPGGLIDQEKQMLAHWESLRPHAPEASPAQTAPGALLPWVVGGAASLTAGALGALALWRHQRGVHAQPQTNWRRVFYWTFISIALLTGVLAILHGFHVIDLPSWLSGPQTTSSIGSFNTDHAALGGSAMAAFVTRPPSRTRSYGRFFGLTLIATLMFGMAPSLWSQARPAAPPAQVGAPRPASAVRTQRLTVTPQINAVSRLIEEFVQWRIEGGEPPWQDNVVVAQFFNSSREIRYSGYLESVDYVPSFDRTIFFLERPQRGQQGITRATYSEEGYGIYLVLNSNGTGTRADAFVSSTPDGRFLIEKTGDSPYTFKVTPLPADPGSEAYYHRLAATDPTKIFAQFDQLVTRPWGPEVILRAGEAMPDEIVRILIEGPAAQRQALRGMLQKTNHPVLPRLLDIASGPYPRDIKLRLALLVEKIDFPISSNEAKMLAPEDTALQKRLEAEQLRVPVAAEAVGNEGGYVRFLQWILEDATVLNNPPRGYASIIQYLKSHNQPLKVVEHGELTVPSGKDQTEVAMAVGLGLRYIPELAKLADENRFHASVYFTDDILASLQKLARERPNDPLTQKYVENQTRLSQTGGVKFDALTLIGANDDGTLEVMTIIDPSNMKSEAALVAAEVHEEAHVAVIFRHLDAWRAGTYPASTAENEIETGDLTIKALEAAVADPELQKAGPNLVNALRGAEGIGRETAAREMWRKQLPAPQKPRAGIDRMDWFRQNFVPRRIQQNSKHEGQVSDTESSSFPDDHPGAWGLWKWTWKFSDYLNPLKNALALKRAARLEGITSLLFMAASAAYLFLHGILSVSANPWEQVLSPATLWVALFGAMPVLFGHLTGVLQVNGTVEKSPSSYGMALLKGGIAVLAAPVLVMAVASPLLIALPLMQFAYHLATGPHIALNPMSTAPDQPEAASRLWQRLSSAA